MPSLSEGGPRERRGTKGLADLLVWASSFDRHTYRTVAATKLDTAGYQRTDHYYYARSLAVRERSGGTGTMRDRPR